MSHRRDTNGPPPRERSVVRAERDKTVCLSFPSFPCTNVEVVGTIASEHRLLSDGTAVISVEVSQYVRNRVMNFRRFLSHCEI